LTFLRKYCDDFFVKLIWRIITSLCIESINCFTRRGLEIWILIFPKVRMRLFGTLVGENWKSHLTYKNVAPWEQWRMIKKETVIDSCHHWGLCSFKINFQRYYILHGRAIFFYFHFNSQTSSKPIIFALSQSHSHFLASRDHKTWCINFISTNHFHLFILSFLSPLHT
jgi:hypothetical protein